MAAKALLVAAAARPRAFDRGRSSTRSAPKRGLPSSSATSVPTRPTPPPTTWSALASIALLRQIGPQSARPRPVRLQRAVQVARCELRARPQCHRCARPGRPARRCCSTRITTARRSGPARPTTASAWRRCSKSARFSRTSPLKRPVILLFNEGEELGLVGARAFLADPLSRNVDSLINLEARGVRGPVNMFETSRPERRADRRLRRGGEASGRQLARRPTSTGCCPITPTSTASPSAAG